MINHPQINSNSIFIAPWGLCESHIATATGKFRSQTSDNMDRWKAEMGRVREKRRERAEKDQRRERVRRKKMQVREKVGKSRNTVFFQWFVAPEGRKVGSLKRRVRSHLARWEMKSCTPLWREAHLQAKSKCTFGKCTPVSDHFWKLRCRKSARRCGAKHISKSKCTKTTHHGAKLRNTFGSWDVEKVHAVVARSTFRSQNVKNTMSKKGFGPLLDVQMSFRVAGARDCAPCQKWAKREGFVAVSTTTTTTPHYTPIHYTTTTAALHTTSTLHSTTLHYT